MPGTREQLDRASDILVSDASDNLKLKLVFDIYKDNLQQEYSQLYYALLGWKDTHLNQLLREQAEYERVKGGNNNV